VYPILTIAAKGLATQSKSLEAAARSAASRGPIRPTGRAQALPATVRVRALPVGNPILNIVTLAEVERAYRTNAAAMATAAGMLVPVIDLVPAEEPANDVPAEPANDVRAEETTNDAAPWEGPTIDLVPVEVS
jgi:hypothetical protein